MNNIYYVGRNQSPHRRQTSKDSDKYRRHFSSESKTKQRLSSSSRKTQHQYSRQNYQKIRFVGNYNSPNHFNNPIKNSPIKTASNSRKLTFNPRQLYQNSYPNKITFNKVQQSKNKTKYPYLKVQSPKENINRLQQQNMRQISTSKHQKVQQNQVVSFQKSPIAITQQQDDLSEYNQLYRIQPKSKIFLCNDCCQFYPMIEIKTHYTTCKKPIALHQYIKKWSNLVQLLQSLNLTHPSNSTSQLVDLMNWYIHRDKLQKSSNFILYSQELDRILSYRQVVTLNYINKNDLFSMIQKIGDKIQTNSGSTPFWMFCS